MKHLAQAGGDGAKLRPLHAFGQFQALGDQRMAELTSSCREDKGLALNYKVYLTRDELLASFQGYFS